MAAVAPQRPRRSAGPGASSPGRVRGPPRAQAAASRAASSGSRSSAPCSPASSFMNVAVLRLNIRLDQLGRDRTQLRADDARSPRSCRARRRPARIQALGAQGARLVPADPTRDHVLRSRGPERSERDGWRTAGSACCSRSSALAFALDLRPRGLAPGRARAGARAARRPAAPRDGDHARRPRDDLRPDGRAARDRRAGDDRLRRPAAGAEPAARSRSRRARRCDIDPNKIYPQLLEQEAELRLRRRGRPIPSGRRRSSGAASPGSASIRRSGASTRSTRVASQVLGYAGVDNNGLAGLELGLERDLAGRPGKETIVRDPFGRTIDVVSSTPEQPGRDVFLTLDHTLQAKVESVLRTTVARWHAPTARRSCSTRRRAACSRWPSRRASTPTTSRRCRAACSGTARSPTPTSRARRSRSSPTRRR